MTDSVSDHETTFVSEGLEPDSLFVRSVRGTEGLSKLYEFDILVQSRAPLTAADVDAMFAKTAQLTVGTEVPRTFTGVLRSVEMQSTADVGHVDYRVVLVPQLWYATQMHRSKVFQDQTVIEIVTVVLKELGMQSGTHFEMRTSAKHPKREFTVQYDETDYAFLSRMLEYEGMFFFFEPGDASEKLVIADANAAFAELDGHATLRYDARGGVTDGDEPILSIVHERRSVPKKVALRDYNYRTPSLPLAVDAPAADKGVGLQVFYGEHFKDLADGKRVAKLRAEEILAQQSIHRGTSVVRGLRPGHKFTLEDHLVDELNQDYYVTDVEHTVQQSGMQSGGGNEGYTNQFVARAASVVFRPQRVTPHPVIAGVMHAKIDAATSGTAAPIDDQGRYKVLLPYDVAGQTGGKASRWIRMAQHYSGPGYGSHFPLHAGSEVILVHIDGDPDRPIIAAAVPNPEMLTPVVAGNATQSVIRSHAGIHIEFEDDA